jgi:hypothetical protein
MRGPLQQQYFCFLPTHYMDRSSNKQGAKIEMFPQINLITRHLRLEAKILKYLKQN